MVTFEEGDCNHIFLTPLSMRERGHNEGGIEERVYGGDEPYTFPNQGGTTECKVLMYLLLEILAGEGIVEEQLQLKFSKYCVSKSALPIIMMSEYIYIFVLSAGMNKCIFSEFQAYGPSVSSTAIDLTYTLGPLVPQLWEIWVSCHQISSRRMIKHGKGFPWTPALYGWVH